MRISATLETDVGLGLKKKMADEKLTLKEAVNRTLRAGLEASGAGKRARFRVIPHSFGFKPGIELDKLNQLADRFEVEEFARKSHH
jgi:hypothetical protein